jgi:predicted N-acetyltransferase YhbS
VSAKIIRTATTDDIAAVKAIAIDTGLFDAEGWVNVEAMLMESVKGQLQDHVWIVLEDDDTCIVGAAYYAPEPFSDRMWNLYFLAVQPGRHGRGTGAALVAHVEDTLRTHGARVLIIETSGVEGFEPTRGFYRAQGYDQEARIREFYGPGDDKVVFWKALYESS